MVIDLHTHAFPDGLAGHAVRTINERVPAGAEAVLDGTVGALLGSMDAAGIERSVICSIATAPRQVEPILRWSAGVRSERIVPFASVHPGCEDPAAWVRRTAEAGLAGVKLHPQYQGFAADEARLWPVYGAVAERGLVLLIHAGRDIAFPPDDDRAAPKRILAVHRAFPGLRMVVAHLGGWRMWEEAAATLAGADLYLETSYSFGMGHEEAVGRVVGAHPADRILFGSDSPWRDQAEALALVREALAGTGALDGVLQANAERLLGQSGGG
jgi:hypothetical protein